MAYKIKVPDYIYYKLDYDEITPELNINDVIDPEVVNEFAFKGMYSKLDFIQKTDQELLNINTVKAPITTEDIRRIRKWCESGIPFEKGKQAVALRPILIRRTSTEPRVDPAGKEIYDKSKKFFAPGEIITEEWITPAVREILNREYPEGDRPSCRWRTKADK